jgi:hypothetical protein
MWKLWRLGWRDGPFDPRVVYARGRRLWKRVWWRFYWRVS